MPSSSTSSYVSRVCPLCGSDRAEELLEKGGLHLVKCQACSMVFANPVELELASGTFYDQRGNSFYLSPEKLASDYNPVRFERELRLFRAYCSQGKVLDVGCSTGAFLFNLKQRFPGNYDLLGTDVTSAALDHAEKQGIRVVRDSFLDYDFGTNAFDAVTFWAVMEHLVHPTQFLKKAASVLKPRGHCFILVPNLQSLAVRLLGAKYRYIMPDHVNYFTRETLKAFGRSTGDFDMVHMTTTHFNPVVILKDFRGKAARVSDQERAELLKRTTRWKTNPLLKPVKLAYGVAESILATMFLADNLVAVLRKKA